MTCLTYNHCLSCSVAAVTFIDSKLQFPVYWQRSQGENRKQILNVILTQIYYARVTDMSVCHSSVH